jgi:indolepyruvate ferredoxin oxidoreductase alpha subunit
VIVADGECQLARQRRIRPQIAGPAQARRARGAHALRRRRRGLHRRPFLHPAVGLPSLVVKPSPDPLRSDPVAHVNNGCVGCGLCGEVADAAVLCPSFYKADIVQNASWWDRLKWRVRSAAIGVMA